MYLNRLESEFNYKCIAIFERSFLQLSSECDKYAFVAHVYNRVNYVFRTWNKKERRKKLVTFT